MAGCLYALDMTRHPVARWILAHLDDYISNIVLRDGGYWGVPLLGPHASKLPRRLAPPPPPHFPPPSRILDRCSPISRGAQIAGEVHPPSPAEPICSRDS
ncbi:hypothetical protein ZWY2020_013149 [Hordeum vulgare]|nr:hypothetical protein ZWY2020_013149 [Hordeum vulgare]